MVQKKSNLGKLIFLACLTIILVLFLFSCTSATNPYVQSLDIDMQINEDGSADIVHKRVINFSNRGDDWWNYYLKINLADNNKGNYGNVVSQLKNLQIAVDNVAYPIDDILSQQDLDYFSYSQKYQYKNKAYANYAGNNVELGVVMPMFSSGVRTVTFSYTLTNLLIQYSDSVGLYYKFVDEGETNFIKNFNATVSFANPNNDNVEVWTHNENGSARGDLNQNLNKVVYIGGDIQDGNYIETRLLLLNKNYGLDKKNDLTSAQIKAEEEQWRADFEKELKKAKIVSVVDKVLAVLAVVIAVFLLFFTKKKLKHKPLANSPIYYRDIPQGWSAGEMSPLYHYYSAKSDVSDSMSATILELCRRGYIKIDVGSKKKSGEISILQTNKAKLRQHEAIVFDMLVKVSLQYGGSFSMKQMESYAKKDYTSFANDIERYKSASKEKTTKMGCYPSAHTNKTLNLINGIKYLFIALAVIIALNTYFLGIGGIYLTLSILGFLVGFGILYIYTKKLVAPLTEVGQQNYDMFVALGKFMQEFSNMKDHELPQLVLWEEFMVYATAMGIADKVAEQIEIAYPEYKQMVESAYSGGRSNNTFLILYLMSPRIRMNTNFALSSMVRQINSNVANISRQAAITAAAKKFGGGIGGGFRGGGGGFGGGGGGAR